MKINWVDAPEWANVVVDAYSRLFYLEHNHSGKITYAQRVDGSGGRMTSTDNHVWWEFDVVDVRPDVVPYELTSDCVSGCACTAERNIFISQAYAIYNSTKPKYEVFGAMFDAGCRFPEE